MSKLNKKISAAVCLAVLMSCYSVPVSFAAAADTKKAPVAEKKSVSIQDAAPTTKETLNLTLQGALNRAADYNRQIRLSKFNADHARWQRSEVRRSHSFNLSWDFRGGRIGGKGIEPNQKKFASSDVDYYHDYSHTFTASFPLYTGGKLRNSILAADYGLDVADLSLEATKQAVREGVTQAYFNVLRCFNLVKVHSDSVGTLTAHLKNVEAQFEVGTVAKTDVLRSRVAVANAEQTFTNALNDYYVSVSTLNNLIGLPTGHDTRAVDELEYRKLKLDFNECLDYALKHRPDGIAAERQMKAARAQVNAERAGWHPTVAVVGTRSTAGEGFSHTDHDSSDSWFAGVSVSWNVFDNGVTQAKVNEAKAQYNQALESSLAKLDDIRLEVRKAYLGLIAAEQNIATNGAAVAQAEEDCKIARLRYDNGVGTNIDVMDAEDYLTQTRTNYVTSLYNFNTSKAALDKAMGVAVDLDVHAYTADASSHPTTRRPYHKMKKKEGYVAAPNETNKGAVPTGELNKTTSVVGRKGSEAIPPAPLHN